MSFFSISKLAQSYAKKPFLWTVGLFITIIPAAYLSSQLTLKSDFKRLLPDQKPSVINLNKIVDRVGGEGSLMIGIETDDVNAMLRFMDDLATELRKLPPKYVRYLEYNIQESKDFFTKNKYLYADLTDLKEIHDRLAKKIRYEKLQKNPFFIALDEDKVEFDISDIEEKYKNKSQEYEKFFKGYFTGEMGKLGVMVIRPSGTSTGTGFSKELIAKVDEVVQKLNPKSYHPSIRIEYTGKYQQVLDEYSQLIRDIFQTLGLCLFLVAAIIYLYFFRFRVIGLLTATLGAGVAWTFAFTKMHIGHLNSQTAFLGSIIVGNGVNSGIILLARYLEERRGGKEVAEALEISLTRTWMATFASAITTSAAFAALSLSEIRGFSEFGFIGGLGMILCWLATYTVLPPLLVISEKILPMVKSGVRKTSAQWESILNPVGSLVLHSPKIIGTFGLALAVFSLILAARFLPNALEYDFSKLKNKADEDIVGGRSMKDRIRDNIFGENTSPSIILLDREDQAKYVCDAVMSREAGMRDHEKTIESCRTLRSYLPEEQSAKLKELKKIKKLLEDKSINFIKGEYREELENFRKEVDLRELTLEDLPLTIQRNFLEMDGSLGKIVYVYPRRDAKLSNGKRLMQFAEVLSAVRLADGSVVSMSGQAAIFADLLKAVVHDGPFATLYSFLAVGLIISLTFRRLRPISYILGGLLVGVSLMLGMQAILGIKLNFFNFIALPVTFGIGVDYGVNVLQRYRFEGVGSIRRVIGTVGGAILLCSLTTIISYATLLTARNQALASFGFLALLGELSCLFAGVVIMPAILHWRDKRHLSSVKPIITGRHQRDNLQI